MNARKSNMRYLKAISDKLKEIPREVAKSIAFMTYVRAVEVTVVDSGQAALNWNMEAYNGTLSPLPFKELAGTDTRAPTGGAGYKRWYASESEGKLTGDPFTVFATAYANGVNQLLSMEGKPFEKISVYAPIPGQKYQINAFLNTSLQYIAEQEAVKAYIYAKTKYKDVL